MKQIPEISDIDDVTKACDYLMDYMRRHESNPEVVVALTTIFHFCSRVKHNVGWLENLVKILKK